MTFVDMSPARWGPSLAPAPRPARWRVAIVALAAVAALGGTAAVFWYADWQYAAPTPVPAGYTPPAVGEYPASEDAALSTIFVSGDGRPTLLHFYNHDCPCSRFNATHFAELRRAYGGRLRFVAVVPDADGAAGSIGGGDVEVVTDTEGHVARAAGVYATPQGVLLDGSGRLWFRGNYNLGRFCTDPGSQFVRLAAEALLEGRQPESLRLPPAATVAYGCQLPTD